VNWLETGSLLCNYKVLVQFLGDFCKSRSFILQRRIRTSACILSPRKQTTPWAARIQIRNTKSTRSNRKFCWQ